MSEYQGSEDLGVVLYTDGSYLAEANAAGYGIHGYAFTEDVPKRGAGLNGFYLTKDGYVERSDDVPQVTPVFYIDVFETQTRKLGGVTNNTAELQGYISALEIILGRSKISGPFKYGTIISDSRYVLEGIKFYPKWKANGWTLSSGKPAKNVDLWEHVALLHVAVEERNLHIEHRWTKGHATDPGNICADVAAGIGKDACISKGKHEPERGAFVTSPPEGYWKPSTEFPRLFGSHYVVFTGASKSSDPGRYSLFADASKKSALEAFGTPLIHASYAVVKLTEPSDLVDGVMDGQRKKSGSDIDVFMVRPQEVYKANAQRAHALFGEAALSMNHRGIATLGGEEVSRKHYPVRQGMKGVQHLEVLNDEFDRIHRYVENGLKDLPDGLRIYEVTEHFYDYTSKTKKGKKGEDDIVTVTAKLRTFPENDDQFVTVDDGTGKTLRLIYGIDLPTRNAMADAAKKNGKVFMVEQPSDGLIPWRGVYMATDEGVGLWHNPYAGSFASSFLCRPDGVDTVKQDAAIEAHRADEVGATK